MRLSRWILKKTKEWALPPFEDLLLSFFPFLVMNIIVWNCRGALKLNFQDYVEDLVRHHDPAIFVVTETQFRGYHLMVLSIPRLLVEFGDCG